MEWTNKKSLVLSLSEVAIYSGFNRSFDIAYLNPISSHLELELNKVNDSGNILMLDLFKKNLKNYDLYFYILNVYI